jgi:hypothetical protein
MRGPAQRHRRRFAVACLVGGVLALVGFLIVLHASPGGLFRRESLANFYDAQADAWLHGRWNVPAADLFIEGFRIHGKTYTYFGAWPALLRVPVLAVTGGPYGHLTGLSMTLAFAVALVGTSTLHWRLRTIFRPDRPTTTGECVLAAATVLTVGCGTTFVFLASRAWVYHEAILWGAAWAIVAFERVVAFARRPTTGALVGAAAFGGLAFCSRASVGMGPLLALGLVLAGRLLRAVRTRWATRADGRPARALRRLDWLGGADDGRTWLLPLVAALVIPIAVYAYVNWSRFGTPFSVPWTKQALTAIDARHRAVLAANGGTYFGLKFAPTTLVQFLRPDALSFDPHFPWVTFPRFRTPVFGHVRFDTLDWSTSVVASMPALVLLGAVGIAAAVRPRFGRAPEAAYLRVPLLGALGGVVLTVAIAFVANRYLGDWVPLLVLAALIGLQALLRRGEEPGRQRRTRVWLATVAALALFGIVVNVGLGLQFARLFAPQRDPDRAAFLALQQRLSVGGPYALGRGATLPRPPAAAGTTFVLGACRSVYWSDGQRWHPVEGTRAGGWYRLLVDPAPDATGWQPVLTNGPPGRALVLGLKPLARGRLELGFGRLAADGHVEYPAVGYRGRFGPGPYRIDAVMDPALGYLRVAVDGVDVLFVQPARSVPDGPVQVGAAGPQTFAGTIRTLPDRTDLCRDLAAGYSAVSS